MSRREDDRLLLSSAACCPVVLLTHDISRAMLKRAQRAGVMACLVEPPQPAEVAPTLDLAVPRFRDARTPRRALADRKLIDRAKGKLMARDRLTEEEAFQWLRRRAMDTRPRLGEVARKLLA